MRAHMTPCGRASAKPVVTATRDAAHLQDRPARSTQLPWPGRGPADRALRAVCVIPLVPGRVLLAQRNSPEANYGHHHSSHSQSRQSRNGSGDVPRRLAPSVGPARGRRLGATGDRFRLLDPPHPARLCNRAVPRRHRRAAGRHHRGHRLRGRLRLCRALELAARLTRSLGALAGKPRSVNARVLLHSRTGAKKSTCTFSSLSYSLGAVYSKALPVAFLEPTTLPNMGSLFGLRSDKPSPSPLEGTAVLRAQLADNGLQQLGRREWWLWFSALSVTLLSAVSLSLTFIPSFFEQAQHFYQPRADQARWASMAL